MLSTTDNGGEHDDKPLKKIHTVPAENHADADADDNTTTDTDESILPPVTEAVLVEYQKEVALKEAAAKEGRRKSCKSLLQVCGIPSFLMLILILLIVLVILGTVLAVVFDSADSGIQPPFNAPSMMVSLSPSPTTIVDPS